MSAAEALQAARDAGVSLEVDGDDIVLEAPTQPPRAVLDLLVRHKASIVTLLRPARDDLSIRHGEILCQRRAAIEDRRTWTEALTRLDPASTPEDIPPRCWVQFIDDCRHFIETDWSVRAAELGWTALELFGCHRSKPFARIGMCGLLWLLNGRQLRILTADTAVINTASDSGVTFYRRHQEPGQVLAWELEP